MIKIWKKLVFYCISADPMQIFFCDEYGKNVCPRKTAHAQTMYQENNTSGRGARASSHIPR